MSIAHARSPLSRLKSSMWHEWKATKDTAGQLRELERALDYPPGWFVAVELGFGTGESPSIVYTLATLDRDNKRRAKMSNDKAKKRRTGKDWKRLAQRVAA